MGELTHANGRPYGMPKKDYARLLDVERFDDWRKERGGDEELTRWVCAQVSGGCTLKTLCEHYVVEYGLLWEWLSSDPERLARYYRAQRGVADAFVSEVVPIADDESVDVGSRKVRTHARLAVSAKYDRERFGEREHGGVVIDMRDRRRPEELQAEIAALVAANPGLRLQLGRVIDAVVTPEAPTAVREIVEGVVGEVRQAYGSGQREGENAPDVPDSKDYL